MRTRTAAKRELSVRELIDQLGSVSPCLRSTAARQLRKVGPDAVEPLIRRLNRESPARVDRLKMCVGFTTIGVCFYFWLVPQLLDPAKWLLLPALLPVAWVVMRLTSWSPLEIQATSLLAQIDDIRAVGPLAEALEARDLWTVSQARALAAESLVRLLPKLTEEDASLLNAKQRECLYRALSHTGMYNPDLTRAIIHVMKVMGDESAEKHLSKLIENWYFVGRHSEMQVEAEEAIQAIHKRIALARAPDVLLRASEPETPSGLLLRATVTNSATPEDQLLRVTVAERDKAS